MEQLDLAMSAVDALTKIILFVISVIGTFATAKLPAKWRNEAEAARKQAEAIMREALHSAAETGVATGREKGLTGFDLVRFAMLHMIKSVPDAIAGLTKIPRETLNEPADTVISVLPAKTIAVLENIVRAKEAVDLARDLAGGIATAIRKR